MTMTITLTQNEIKKIIERHLQEEGWSPNGPIEIRISPGCSDQRDFEAPLVTAVIKVTKAGSR